MSYQSITRWQAEDYLIEVAYGDFDFELEAISFASRAHFLISSSGSDCLFLSAGDDGIDDVVIRDDNIKVFKLKKSSVDAPKSRVLKDTDFDEVEISISEFKDYPALGSFGSLSYGQRKTYSAKEE